VTSLDIATQPRKLGGSTRSGVPPAWPMRRWTVDEYHRIQETGLLDDGPRVEMLHGWITVKHPDTYDDSRDWDRKRPDIPPSWEMWKWSVEEYHKLIETGILGPEDRVELIRGWLVLKMTVNPPHAYAVTYLNRWFIRNLDEEDWVVRTQNPLSTDDSEPEPDLLVAPGPLSLYKARHPCPADAMLVVEVADSTLRYDRTTKLELYAQARVPEYWIVNLIDGIVEVYSQPRKGTYRKRTDYTAADSVPVILGKKTLGRIPVKEFLP
jgi:Uma2 family endonuclease